MKRKSLSEKQIGAYGTQNRDAISLSYGSLVRLKL